MLYSLVHSKELVRHTPHQEDFERWKTRLTPDERRAIFLQINADIDRATEASGCSLDYRPCPDWMNGAYRPILLKACSDDQAKALRCFAIFVWEVFRRKDGDWTFRRPNATRTQIEEFIYYRF